MVLQYVLGTFLFCAVLFFYIHIIFQLRTGDELEVYTIDQASKEQMEEMCDIKQPILFQNLDSEFTDLLAAHITQSLSSGQYNSFEVKVKDEIGGGNGESVLDLKSALMLFGRDGGDGSAQKYYSDDNSSFLCETGIVKQMKYYDDILRPPLVSAEYYDLIMGSASCVTPMRYDLNYRNYYVVTRGSVKVKLTLPMNSKYLYPVNDYDNFEFRALVNPWSPQEKYARDFSKIKCLEFELGVGQVLYVPAYWWYSFQFVGEGSCMCSFKYCTYMNWLAMTPQLVMYGLQRQNVKSKYLPVLDLKVGGMDEGVGKDVGSGSGGEGVGLSDVVSNGN